MKKYVEKEINLWKTDNCFIFAKKLSQCLEILNLEEYPERCR